LKLVLHMQWCYHTHMNMNTVTIPRRIVKNDDLIVMPRRDYEALLEFRKIQEFKPTAAQRQSLVKAEANLRKGKTLKYDELVGKLGFAN